MVNNFVFKSAVLVLFILLLTAGVSALSISAEPNIPVGTQWSFSVNYSLPSGADLKLYLDSALVFSAFERAGNIYLNEQEKSPKILLYSISKEQVTLSLAGLEEKNHEIKAIISSSGTVLDSASQQIIFSRAMTSFEKQDLYLKISSLENTISAQNKTIDQLQNNLTGKQSELDALKQKNSELLDSLKQITSEVTLLQESDKTKQESLEKINLDLNALVASQEKNLISSMFAFSQQGSFVLGAFAILILVIIAAALYLKKTKHSLYKK